MADLILNMYLRAHDEFSGVFARLSERSHGATAAIGALSLGIGVLAGGILVESVKQASDFQTQLTNVANNTTMTTGQINEMRDAILSLADNSSAPMSELEQGWMHISDLLGNDATANTMVLKAAMESAVSTGGNVADTANVLANAMHEFSIPAQDAAHAMDVLHLAAAMGNTTLEQFVDSSGRALGMAANLGVSMEEASAAISALTRHGYDASTASTQLIGMLEHITNPAKSVRNEIGLLARTTGVDLTNDFSQAGVQAKGLSGVLDDVRRATHGNSAAIEKLIPALRGGLGAMTLTGTGANDFHETLKALNATMAGKSDPTTQAYTRTQATLGFQLGELHNRLQEVFITIGEALVPVLNKLVAAMLPIIQHIADWIKHHADLTVKILAGVAVVGTLIGALLLLAPLFGLIASQAGLMVLGFIEAVAGTALVVTHFHEIQMVLRDVWNVIRRDAINLWRDLTSIWSNIMLDATGLWNYLWTNLSDIWNGVVTTANTIWGNIVDFFSNLWDNVTATWDGFWTAVGTDLHNIWTGITTDAQSVWTGIGSFFTNIWNGISTAWNNLWSGIGTLLHNLWTGITQDGQAVWNGIGSFFGNIWNGISTVWNNVWSGIGTTLHNLWTGITSDASNVWGGISSFFNNVWGGIASGWNGFWSNLGTTLHNLWTGITSDASAVWGGISSYFGGVWGTIRDGWTGFWNNIGTMLHNLWTGITGDANTVWNGMSSFFGGVWGTIRTGWDTFWNAIGTLLHNVWTGITGDANAIWNGVASFFNNVWGDLKSGWQGFWNDVGTTLHNIWTGIQNTAKSVWDATSSLVKNIWTGTSNIFQGAWNTIKSTLQSAWDAITNVANTAWGWLTNAINTAWDFTSGKFNTVWGTIKTALGGAWDGIKTMASTAWNSLTDLISHAWDGLVTQATNFSQQVVMAIYNVWGDTSSGLASAVQFLKSLKDKVWNDWGQIVSDATTKAGEFVNAFINKIKDTGSGLVATWEGWWHSGASLVGQFEQDAADFLNSALTFGSQIIYSIIEGVKSAAEQVASVFAELLKVIHDHFPASPAKRGPFQKLPTFTWIADQMRAAIPSIEDASKDIMSRMPGGNGNLGLNVTGRSFAGAVGAGGNVFAPTITIQGGMFTNQQNMRDLTDQVSERLMRDLRTQGMIPANLHG